MELRTKCGKTVQVDADTYAWAKSYEYAIQGGVVYADVRNALPLHVIAYAVAKGENPRRIRVGVKNGDMLDCRLSNLEQTGGEGLGKFGWPPRPNPFVQYDLQREQQMLRGMTKQRGVSK